MTTRKLDTGSDQLLCSVTGHVATITLNNPKKKNALSESLSAGLRKMLADTATDPDVRVLVVTGADGAFCAGGDIGGMGASLAGGGEPDPDTMIESLRKAQNAISLTLYQFPKPTIAALPGPAAGAGMSIALACDMRIAGQSAFLAPAFGKIGLSGDFGGSWYMSKLIGPARTKEIYFSSRPIDSTEAHALGLFNRVVEDGVLERETQTLAREIADGPPIALTYMKANINRAADCDLQTALDAEADAMIRAMLTDDHKTAAKAFFEKSPVTFSGK